MIVAGIVLLVLAPWPVIIAIDAMYLVADARDGR